MNEEKELTNGHSSPGVLHSMQQASNGILHIPHVSSPAVHFQVAATCDKSISMNSDMMTTSNKQKFATTKRDKTREKQET